MKLQRTALFVLGLVALQAMAEDKPSTTAPATTTAAQPATAAKPATGNGVSTISGMPGAGQPAPEMPDIQKLSYAIGMNWGSALKGRVPDANLDAVFNAIKDTMNGKSQMTEQEARDVLAAFNRASMAKEAEKARIAAEKNKTEGEAFLAKNGKESGVITLASGLQYQVITEGTGAIPKGTDTVTVNYKGTLIDGKEFDSSLAPGRKPITCAVTGGVIKGWTEALQLMKVGSKWKVFVPSALGYGPSGRPPKIEGNSVLIFEMELLSIKEPVATAASDAQGISGDIIKVPSQEEMKKGAKIEVIKAGQTNAAETK